MVEKLLVCFVLLCVLSTDGLEQRIRSASTPLTPHSVLEAGPLKEAGVVDDPKYSVAGASSSVDDTDGHHSSDHVLMHAYNAGTVPPKVIQKMEAVEVEIAADKEKRAVDRKDMDAVASNAKKEDCTKKGRAP